MKVDVIVTSATDDDSKFRSRSTDESKTRLVRRSRLAEQIEAEEVLLSNDIETRLQDHGDWYRGKKGGGDVPPASKRSHRGASSSSDDQFDWASASDDDTGPGIEVPRIAVNVKTSAPGGFFVRPAGSSTPSSPPADDPDKNLDATAMETDISSFFPAAAKTKTKTKTKTAGDLLCPRKEGLSPRQRLLQRYQMEEMMTLMNESNVDVERGELPDGSDASGFRDVESDFVVDRPDSPYSSSRSVGTDAVDGNPGQNHHPTDGLIRDCHICGYPPCSRADYDLHMKNVHFTHKCHLCVYWSRSPGRLARHLKDFHGEPTDTAVANRKPKNPRKYTCKHCDFYTYVQEEIWKHTRAHVPAAKLLSCPHCPFVCAFKHHMQYHMNNHLGHKPFKCGECNYRCNNKSMLNSHKKSHSNDYPYRCGVCNYAAKYRHALNIHLRKKKHLADGEVVLEEGHRHRGGGRSRHRGVGVGGGDLLSRNTDSGNPVSVGRVPPSFLPEQLWRQGSARIGNVADYCRVKQEPDGESGPVGTAYPHAGVYAGLSGSSPQPPLISISDLSRNAEELLQRYSPVVTSARTTAVVVQTRLVPPMSGRAVQPHSSSSISLVKPAASTSLAPAQSHHHHHQQHQQLQEQHHHHSSIYDITNQSRRCLLPPGRPFPPADNSYRTLPYIGLQEQGYSRRNSEEEWPLDLTAKPPNPGRPEPHHHHQNHHRTSPLGSGTESPRLDWYECQHCGIIFPDRVLYTMHMEYHGPSDPFRCGLCGQRTQDRREFFNHISQFAHN